MAFPRAARARRPGNGNRLDRVLRPGIVRTRRSGGVTGAAVPYGPDSGDLRAAGLRGAGVGGGTVPGPRAGGSGPVSLDWARVAATVDAVWLTRRGLIRLNDWGQPFHHWAVETVVNLNPSALAPEQRKHGSDGPPAAHAAAAPLPRPGSMAAGSLSEARRSAAAQAGWLSGIAEGSDQLENDLIAGGITAASGTLQAVRAARESTAAAARAWQQVDAYLGRQLPGRLREQRLRRVNVVPARLSRPVPLTPAAAGSRGQLARPVAKDAKQGYIHGVGSTSSRKR